jgi:hypothetical protein
MRREFEITLTTYDGAQHLRLHGWLKRNQALIKAESILGKDSETMFGSFTAYMDNEILEKLKEDNLQNGLYCDIEVLNIPKKDNWGTDVDYDHSGTWTGDDSFFKFDKSSQENFFEKIQNFMINFDKDSIKEFVVEANNKSIDLFKSDPSFIKEYVETKDMSRNEKIKDLNIMIEAFEKEERYEDCALLVKIKEKIELNYLKQKIRGNE